MQQETTTDLFTHLFQKPIYTTSEPISPPFINLENKEIELPQLLLLLKNAFNQEIQAADFELLKKMADWLGIDRKEVAVYLMKEDSLSFRELKTNYGIENIICYGPVPADIGLNIEYHLNKTVRFMNCKILFTASFAEVQKNDVLKKEFFNEAGKLFNRTVKK
ncbi:MAG: hypothetical protein ABIO46_13815 [Chitinophagales bacterium]